MKNSFELSALTLSGCLQTLNPIPIFHLTFRLALQEFSNIAPSRRSMLLPFLLLSTVSRLRCVSYFFSIVFFTIFSAVFLSVVFVYAVKVQNVNNQNANALASGRQMGATRGEGVGCGAR